MIRTIHHFDDEPELLQWIPGALLTRYWLEHPEWVADDGHFTEDPETQKTCFTLLVGDNEVIVEYRVYRTPLEFNDAFPSAAKVGDIVLLDIMGESPENGSFVPYGLAAFEVAATHVGRDKVYFLTAFPHRLLHNLPVEAARVIAKPPDADALMSLLVQELAVGGRQW